jgi:DNA (cytosine-5)-methyltransferase 1
MEFLDLNGSTFEVKKEKEKREVAKFKYHIPYFIINAYRVELTNYHSDFDRKLFIWDVEVHYSQGKKRAKVYQPQIDVSVFSEHLLHNMDTFIENEVGCSPKSYGDLQKAFCMTEEQRKKKRLIGPYELLEDIKKFIISNVHSKKRKQEIEIVNADLKLPYGIVVGYYLLNQIIKRIGGDTNGY